jgi:hypothetical protein
MSELPQRLERRDARVTLPQGFAQNLPTLLVAIKKHVLLARKVIEHSHPSDVGGGCDLVHRHTIEAPLKKEARGGIGDAFSHGQALTGSAVRWD